MRSASTTSSRTTPRVRSDVDDATELARRAEPMQTKAEARAQCTQHCAARNDVDSADAVLNWRAPDPVHRRVSVKAVQRAGDAAEAVLAACILASLLVTAVATLALARAAQWGCSP